VRNGGSGENVKAAPYISSKQRKWQNENERNVTAAAAA